jgi:putative membrane protein
MHRPFTRNERLQDIGDEPDYRFSLANERTMLAYLRTALALMAAGIALLHLFDDPLDHAGGTALVVAGILVAATSYHRWRAVEAALRRAEPLPLSRVPAAVAVVLTICAIMILVSRTSQP